jgi:DNA adenine methylase
MKTPIGYYGGKQNLVKEILPLLPAHKQYVEPFFGGGAVYFAKPKSENECINDLNFWAVTFYECVKLHFEELQARIQATLHSEALHEAAEEILKKAIPPPLFGTSGEKEEKIAIAWAFWVQCNMSFGHTIFGGFAFSNNGQSLGTANKRRSFTTEYERRLETTEIFCRDAVNLIKLKDGEDTFFYVDPPYVSSNCGHYKGYTTEQFQELLEVLSTIKGKFLMSSYFEEALGAAIDKYGWNIKKIEQILQVTGKRETNKMKVECLTYNYQDSQYKLFN